MRRLLIDRRVGKFQVFKSAICDLKSAIAFQLDTSNNRCSSVQAIAAQDWLTALYVGRPKGRIKKSFELREHPKRITTRERIWQAG